MRDTHAVNLRLSGPHGTALRIGSQIICRLEKTETPQETAVFLPEGIHSLEITPPDGSRAQISLQWQAPAMTRNRRKPGNTPWQPIPPQYLIAPPLPQGFLTPIGQSPAPFQYKLSRKCPLEQPGQTTRFRVALIQTLPGGRMIASDWYLPEMLLLDTAGSIIKTWNPNALNDYDFDQFFQWDIAPGPLVYLTGSRKKGLLNLHPGRPASTHPASA